MTTSLPGMGRRGAVARSRVLVENAVRPPGSLSGAPSRLTVPEALVLYGVALTVLAPVISAAGAAGLEIRTVCPLRVLTGIPCPFCGGTTAALALVRGDLGAALAANPLVVLAAAVLPIVLAVLWLRRRGFLSQPQPWSRRRDKWASGATAALLAASWVVQLVRYGVL